MRKNYDSFSYYMKNRFSKKQKEKSTKESVREKLIDAYDSTIDYVSYNTTYTLPSAPQWITINYDIIEHKQKYEINQYVKFKYTSYDIVLDKKNCSSRFVGKEHILMGNIVSYNSFYNEYCVNVINSDYGKLNISENDVVEIVDSQLEIL